MTSKQGQRAQKRGDKAARRKAVVAAKKKVDLAGGRVAAQAALAGQSPVFRSLVPQNLFRVGIGHVVLARALPSGLLGCGFFLIDTFCLGAKNAFYRELTRSEFDRYLQRVEQQENMMDVDPAKACKIVLRAVDYAARAGIPPHPDYGPASKIMENIDIEACTEEFTFGQNGKPFYVTGPSDTPGRIRRICRTLQERCGTGGWNYMIHIPDIWDGEAVQYAESEVDEEDEVILEGDGVLTTLEESSPLPSRPALPRPDLPE